MAKIRNLSVVQVKHILQKKRSWKVDSKSLFMDYWFGGSCDGIYKYTYEIHRPIKISWQRFLHIWNMFSSLRDMGNQFKTPYSPSVKNNGNHRWSYGPWIVWQHKIKRQETSSGVYLRILSLRKYFWSGSNRHWDTIYADWEIRLDR
jgi:hypothetical protein